MQSKVHSLALFVFALILITATTLNIPLSSFKEDQFEADHQELKLEEKSLRSISQLSNFYGSVTIGHQSLPVLFSTTADFDFIVGKSCTNCLYTAKPFDTDQEPSFFESNERVTQDNGRVKGKVCLLPLKIGDQSGGQTEFVLAESVKYPLQHSGILSLSPKDTSFLTKIYEKGLINEKIFSLQYSDGHPKLHFGISEDELESYQFYPLHEKESWSIDLDNLAMGSKELSRLPSYAVFDTSTDLLILPEYATNNVQSVLKANGWDCQLDERSEVGRLMCKGSFPAKPFSLNLRFNGNSYNIPSSNFMGVCLGSTSEKETQYCQTLIAVNNKEDSVILGHSVLKHFEIIFDAKASRIGLAETMIKDSKYPHNKREATSGILYLLGLGVLIIGFLVVIAWVVQKMILRRNKQILFEEDSHGDGVELATN